MCVRAALKNPWTQWMLYEAGQDDWEKVHAMSHRGKDAAPVEARGPRPRPRASKQVQNEVQPRGSKIRTYVDILVQSAQQPLSQDETRFQRRSRR